MLGGSLQKLGIFLLLLMSSWPIAQGQTPPSIAPNPSGSSAAGNPQTPPGRPGEPQARTGQSTPRSNARNTYVRLSRAPNMFGDSLRPSASFIVTPNGTPGVAADLVIAGASSFNVAENNRALPTDRGYFVYNGFFNAIDLTSPGIQQNTDIHRYTIGFEKTFRDGLWSLDTRMPFTGSYDLNDPNLSTDSGNVGNLSMFLKRLAFQDDVLAISSGLGIGLPTGKDLVVRTSQGQFTIENDAVHLMPFIALTAAPDDDWFVQSFGQIDFAASGHDVITGIGRNGTYTEQSLLQADVALGRWLARGMGYHYLSGIAGVVELHYTSTIQDSDQIFVNSPGVVGQLRVSDNRTDLLNLTSGLHFQLSPLANLRFGVVVPLKNAPDRVFDTELQVSFNRQF
jgi:hypothetical protein